MISLNADTGTKIYKIVVGINNITVYVIQHMFLSKWREKVKTNGKNANLQQNNI